MLVGNLPVNSNSRAAAPSTVGSAPYFSMANPVAHPAAAPSAHTTASVSPAPAPAPADTTTGGGGGGSGGSSGGTPASTSVSGDTINAILQSIANSITRNQQDFDRANASNANDDAQAGIDYGHQVQGNTSSRSTAVQNAEQAAAQGNQGLRAVLASLGALNGTGQILAGRAVASSANNDIGGADQTYQNNATAIENANTAYHNAANDRDANLRANLTTNNQDAESKGIQSILNDATNLGDTGTYSRFLPQLVQATAPAAPIQAVHSTFNPASVNSFAPTSKLNVATAPANPSPTTPVNSALYVKKTQ